MALNLESNKYTFTFAFIVCVVCSFLLSFVSEGLREKKELNAELDVKKNILKAVNLREPMSPKATAAEVLDVFNAKIEEVVIDSTGNVVDGKSPKQIKEGDGTYPLYIYEEDGQKIAYAFPIVGKGLWSTLYGYLALEPDAKTIRGITFYKHGETPGLGAEIEKKWFQDNFEGKSIWDMNKNELWPVAVVKGKVADQKQGETANHFVDGISGATLTSKGVTEMMDRELHKYEVYFSKIRG